MVIVRTEDEGLFIWKFKMYQNPGTSEQHLKEGPQDYRTEYPLVIWERVQNRVLIKRGDIDCYILALGMSGCVFMSPCIESWDESHSSTCRAGFMWFAYVLSPRSTFSLFCHCVKLHAWNDLVMIFQKAPSTELSNFFLNSRCSNSLSPLHGEI